MCSPPCILREARDCHGALQSRGKRRAVSCAARHDRHGAPRSDARHPERTEGRELDAFNGAKIIAMSGGSSQIADDFLPVARQFGARRVLWKPFDIKTLLKLTSELRAE